MGVLVVLALSGSLTLFRVPLRSLLLKPAIPAATCPLKDVFLWRLILCSSGRGSTALWEQQKVHWEEETEN